ncbi:MAG: exodeoxyribonuclease VII small subunit [Candidatus Latescibacteria bacterium 4484_181]|nr:MAG: exodeoxyribonuclease VII small subunit [Candidatus Latescibacteria bacterium 4484_181]
MEEKTSFESRLSRLQEIVEALEAGELTLEQSLELFEEGVKLSRQCTEMLEAAKKRVLTLIREAGGQFRLEMLEKELGGDSPPTIYLTQPTVTSIPEVRLYVQRYFSSPAGQWGEMNLRRCQRPLQLRCSIPGP